MELYILAGIAYLLMLIIVLLFFSGAAIVSGDDYEINDDGRGDAVRHDASYDTSAARSSADLSPACTAGSVPPREDQGMAVGRQAVTLDKRATRSEIA